MRSDDDKATMGGFRLGGLDPYTMFERMIAGVLLLGMVAVILLATWSFLRSTYGVAIDLDDPLDFGTFQLLFDRVLAAVIALELAHSVQQMVAGKHGLTQVKTVIIIGMLAVVRKLILLDVEATSGLFLMGIASAVLALGAAFALVHWIEKRGLTEDVPTAGADGAGKS